MLGKYVTEERLKLGLTQMAAAKMWGMSRAELSMIEAGHRTDIRAATLIKLAKGLDRPVDTFLAKIEAATT